MFSFGYFPPMVRDLEQYRHSCFEISKEKLILKRDVKKGDRKMKSKQQNKYEGQQKYMLLRNWINKHIVFLFLFFFF